jgi:Rap1a immunity proteins
VRIILVVCLIVVGISPTRAAAPTKAVKALPAPVSINIRTAGDLADACTTRPADRVSFARLNFCNGFAQGALQTHRQNASGTKVCMPNPSPKRSETMKEFASWVRADASRKDEVAAWLSCGSWRDGFPASKGGPHRPISPPLPGARTFRALARSETRAQFLTARARRC